MEDIQLSYFKQRCRHFCYQKNNQYSKCSDNELGGDRQTDRQTFYRSRNRPISHSLQEEIFFSEVIIISYQIFCTFLYCFSRCLPAEESDGSRHHCLRDRTFLTIKPQKFKRLKMFFKTHEEGYVAQPCQQCMPEGGGVEGPKMQHHKCSSIPTAHHAVLCGWRAAGRAVPGAQTWHEGCWPQCELCCPALGKGQPKRWLKLIQMLPKIGMFRISERATEPHLKNQICNTSHFFSPS